MELGVTVWNCPLLGYFVEEMGYYGVQLHGRLNN